MVTPEGRSHRAERVGGEAEAVAALGEISNKIGNTAGELGAEDSGILIKIVQNKECSED